MNTDFFTQLYFGTIDPCIEIHTAVHDGSDISHQHDENLHKLLKTMSEDQKSAFERYRKIVSELESRTTHAAFENGFRLGARFALNAFGDRDIKEEKK